MYIYVHTLIEEMAHKRKVYIYSAHMYTNEFFTLGLRTFSLGDEGGRTEFCFIYNYYK